MSSLGNLALTLGFPWRNISAGPWNNIYRKHPPLGRVKSPVQAERSKLGAPSRRRGKEE